MLTPNRDDVIDIGALVDPVLEIVRVRDMAQRLFHDEGDSVGHALSGSITGFGSG